MANPNTVASKSPMTSADCKGNQLAVAYKLAHSILGRSAYLMELVSGVVTNESQLTPKNPQNSCGTDLSGPPWGTAHKHPLWVWEGGQHNSNIFGINPIVPLTAVGDTFTIDIKFFCRPYMPAANTPYSRAYLDANVRAQSGTPVVDFKLWQTADLAGPVMTGQISTSSTTTGGNFTDRPFCYTTPREVNKFRLQFTLSSLGGGTGAEINSLSLSQIARNSH